MAKSNKNKKKGNGKPNYNSNNNRSNRGNQRGNSGRPNQDFNQNNNSNDTPVDIKKGEAVIKANDPSFWMGTELSINAAKYTTDQPYGAPFDSPEPNTEDFTPAGIARYDFVPFYGYVDSSIDSLNYVAKLMYDRINSKNSRDWSYDPSDLMLYILAVANLHALHAFVLRIIGMFNQVFMKNRYIWRPILESMSIKEPDYKTQTGVNTLSAWRDLANDMAILINIFPVPDNIAYFKRIKYMCSNIYFDQDTPKSSISYFCPAGFYGYQYDGSKIGRIVLREAPWYDVDNQFQPGYKVTIDNIKTYFNGLISNLTNDTDVSKMTSDIIKAFPDASWLTAPLIDESFSIDFTFDPLMNEMIHNARPCYHGKQLLDNGPTHTTVSYEQDMNRNCLSVVDGDITLDKTLPDAWMFVNPTKPLPLDFSVENPDENLRMYATRLMWYPTVETVGDNTVYHINCTTELIIDDSVYEFKRDEYGYWKLTKSEKCLISGMGSTASDYKTAIEKASQIAKVNNAPINWIVRQSNGTTGYTEVALCKMMCDLKNYTTLPVYNLKRLNHAATVSIFLPRQLDERIKLDDIKR